MLCAAVAPHDGQTHCPPGPDPALVPLILPMRPLPVPIPLPVPVPRLVPIPLPRIPLPVPGPWPLGPVPSPLGIFYSPPVLVFGLAKMEKIHHAPGGISSYFG